MFRVPTTVCIGLDATIVSAYTKINIVISVFRNGFLVRHDPVGKKSRELLNPWT